jgi:hypothetical protein
MYQHFSNPSVVEGWCRNELVLVDSDHRSRIDHSRPVPKPKREPLKAWDWDSSDTGKAVSSLLPVKTLSWSQDGWG